MFVYTDTVRNITISVDDDLWRRVRDAADHEHVSMNAFIREVLGRTVKRPQDSAAARLAAFAEETGPAPASWKWNREEIYEDAI